MLRRSILTVLAGCVLFFGSLALAEKRPVKYPETRRVDQTDVYHGVEVADPYRWLEEDVRQSEEVAKWVTAQNEVTFAFLE